MTDSTNPASPDHAALIDATAFFGDYPFRGFPQTSLAALQTRAAEYGINGAAISSFHELFWENNLDAVRRTAEDIGNNKFFHHFPVVNPIYPRQLELLPQLLDEIGARGVRLFPTYHRYRLWDERVAALFELCVARQIPVQIFRTLQDERMHWMLSVPPLASPDIEWLLAAPPPGLQVLWSGFPVAEIRTHSTKWRDAKNVRFDLSRVRGPVFAIENLVADFGAAPFVFGSLWPIQMIAPTLRQIGDAQIKAAARTAILGGNWKDLVSGRP